MKIKKNAASFNPFKHHIEEHNLVIFQNSYFRVLLLLCEGQTHCMRNMRAEATWLFHISLLVAISFSLALSLSLFLCISITHSPPLHLQFFSTIFIAALTSFASRLSQPFCSHSLSLCNCFKFQSFILLCWCCCCPFFLDCVHRISSIHLRACILMMFAYLTWRWCDATRTLTMYHFELNTLS